MNPRIKLILPVAGSEDVPEPGVKLTPLFIEPAGKVPGRETPGFFVMRIDGEWVYPEPKPEPALPRQFLSLAAACSEERFGPAPPLPVTKYVVPGTTVKDFPAIWSGMRGKGKQRVTVQVRYIGSFNYWDGRRVDPTRVGTPNEFN